MGMVGALDAEGRRWPSSNTVEALSDGVWAPGVDLCTTDLGGGYVRASGTSFAAPVVAGALTAMRAICPEPGEALWRRAVRAGRTDAGWFDAEATYRWMVARGHCR